MKKIKKIEMTSKIIYRLLALTFLLVVFALFGCTRHVDTKVNGEHTP